jgi:hypothetical protein
MSSVYDYEPKPRNDPIVSIIDSFLDISFPALTPEKAVLLKAFPFCKRLWTSVQNYLLKSLSKVVYIPDWLPGSRIKRETREASTLRDKMIEMPYQYVRKRMVSCALPGRTRVTKQVTVLGISRQHKRCNGIRSHRSYGTIG